MKRYSTAELLTRAEAAIRTVEKELKPKADSYFPSPETTKFFDDRLTVLSALRNELEQEPRFVVHLLGSSQNGKSTLINVLIGKKILTEGHVGACSAAVVRCRRNPRGEYRMTVRYVSKELFLDALEQALKDAGTAWSGEETNERRGEEVRKSLSRFVGFFGLREMSPEQILETCNGFFQKPDTIEFKEFDQTKEVPVGDEVQVDEHLAARGKKAFVVEECILEGPFPEWADQLELMDMPGTNDIDPYRTQVTEATKSRVSGLMLVTRGTQLGGDIINWFKETSILNEVAESTERNQQRVMVVRTAIDDQVLDNVPEDATSLWPHLRQHCISQEAHFRAQLLEVVREKFVDEEIVAKLSRFVECLPIHFVSAKTFRSLSDNGLRNRVLNNPHTPTNLDMMSRFHRFDLDASKTGIPALRKTLSSATEEYLESHFLNRMRSHLEKEVDGIIEFFRRKKLGAELQLAGKAEAYGKVAAHVEKRVTELLSSTENSERLLAQIKTDFQKKAAEVLNHAQHGFGVSIRPRVELWSVLHWRTLRALGSKKGHHTTYDGREYHVQGDAAEIYCQQLRVTWIQDRDRLIETICGDHLTDLVQTIEKIVEEARGYAMAQDGDTAKLVEERMGSFGSKATKQLKALREDFRKKTEDYESLRNVLAPDIKQILTPTFNLIGNEGGTGCAQRMRQHLSRGIDGSLESIHSTVQKQVLSNWETFIQEGCKHTEAFVGFIKEWLAGLKELPAANTSAKNLEQTRFHAEELLDYTFRSMQKSDVSVTHSVSEK